MSDDYGNPINDLPESVFLPYLLRGDAIGPVGKDDKNKEIKTDLDTLLASGSNYFNSGVATDIIGAMRVPSLAIGWTNHILNLESLEGDKGLAWFQVKNVKELRIFDRESGGGVLGSKVELILSSDTGDDDEESLKTGWVDFRGYSDELAEICLARSVAAMAAVSRDSGESFGVRKMPSGRHKGSDGKMHNTKQFIDVRPKYGSDSRAAMIAMNWEALQIAIEDSTEKAEEFLRDEELYDTYRELLFGAG